MIVFAVDRQGKLWRATDPNLPEELFCPLCGAPMSRKVSPLNNSFFAVHPGCPHTHDACRTLDGSSDILDILATQYESFWKRLVGQPHKDTTKSVSSGSDSGENSASVSTNFGIPDNPTDLTIPIAAGESNETNTLSESASINNLSDQAPFNEHYDLITPENQHPFDHPVDFNDIHTSESISASPNINEMFGIVGFENLDKFRTPTGSGAERTKGMYTLAHLAATGHLDCEDCLLADGACLSDITINPRFAYKLLDMPSIGNRILQGRPQRFFDWSQIIRLKIFVATDSVGHKINWFAIADIHIPDQSLYKKIRDILFEKYTDQTTGRLKVRRRYDRVAVAGNWGRIPTEVCQCGWECSADGWNCIGLVHTEIYRMGCVFVFPNKEEKKTSE